MSDFVRVSDPFSKTFSSVKEVSSSDNFIETFIWRKLHLFRDLFTHRFTLCPPRADIQTLNQFSRPVVTKLLFIQRIFLLLLLSLKTRIVCWIHVLVFLSCEEVELLHNTTCFTTRSGSAGYELRGQEITLSSPSAVNGEIYTIVCHQVDKLIRVQLLCAVIEINESFFHPIWEQNDEQMGLMMNRRP